MANGPGGKEYGRVSVRVVPDTSRFAKDLLKDLERIEKSRAAQFKVTATLDSTRVRAELAALKREVSQTDMALGRVQINRREAIRNLRSQIAGILGSVTRGLFISIPLRAGRLGRTTLIVGGLAAAIGGLVSAIGSLGGVVAAALPSLGLLPGIFVSAAAGISTLIVGFKGMGAALTAANPEELAEAMEDLAPAAQKAVRAFRSLGPAAHSLRLDVQQRLMQGWGQVIRRIGEEYLPVLRVGMVGVAGAMNRMSVSIGEFYLRAQTIQDTALVFENTTQAIDRSNRGLVGFLSGLRDLGTVATSFLPEMGDAFTRLGERFAAAMQEMRESGRLREVLQAAIDALTRLGQIAVNVGSTLVSVFTAASNNIGPVFTDLTGSMARFLRSAQGTRMLNQLFGALADILAGIKPVLQEIGRTFVEYLAPAIAEVGPKIGEAFRKLAPAIEPLMRALSDILPILGDIAVVFAEVLTDAIRTLSPYLAPMVRFFADLFEAAQPLLEVLFDLVADVFEALQPILPDIVDAFKSLVEALAPMIDEIAPVLVEAFVAFVEILPPLLGLLEDLLPVFQALAAIIAGVIIIVSKLIEGIAEAAGGFDDLFKLADEHGAKAFTIGIHDIFAQVRGDARDTGLSAQELKDKFHRFMRQMVNDATQSSTEIGNGLKKASSSFGFFSRSARAGAEDAREALHRYVNYLSNVFNPRVRGEAGRAGRGFYAFTQGQREAMERAKEVAANYINQIQNILSPNRRSFWNSGFSLGNSFADGIRAAVGNVGSAALSLAGAAGAALPSSPAEVGPFSGRGWTPYRGAALADGFADGIRSGIPRVSQAAVLMASAVDTAMAKGVYDKLDVGRSLADSIEQSTPEAVRSMERVLSATGGLSAEWRHAVEADGFGDLPDQLADAVSGMTVEMDGKTVGRTVRKVNNADNRRR